MKTGLVLEGGALRTIFSSGVCDALLDGGVMVDYVIGVSAGIAYGVSYISRQPRRNLEIVTRYAGDRRYMGMNNLADRHNRSYFGLEFVYDTIPNELVPFDYQTFAAYPGQVEAVVTNLNTGEAEYMPVPREDDKFLLLQATCALPLMFPIYHLNGQPYLDGGVADSIPYERAFQQGCDRVVVVLSKTRSYVRRPGEAPAGDRADLPGISQLLPGYGAAGRAVQHLPGVPVPAGAGGQGTGAGPGVHPQGIPHRAGYQKAEDAVGRWVSAGGGPDGRDPGFPHAGQSVTSSSAAGQLGWRASRARASPSTVKKAAMRPRSSTSASQARRTASRTAAARRM